MLVFIDKAHIQNKKILLRVDFNVPLTKHKITDDKRIRQTLPTIKKLYKENKVIIISHLGRPKGHDNELSLRPIFERLQKLLPNVKISFVDNFTQDTSKHYFENQKNGEILFLENIRFFKGEDEPKSASGQELAEKLAVLADVYVNDAFGVSHRECVTITELPKFLPHFGGLLLEREIAMISHVTNHPKKPFVAIVGGAKISTKLNLLYKLTEIADFLVLGGALANTMLEALGYPIGKSLAEEGVLDEVKKIVRHAKKNKTKIILPQDVVVGSKNDIDEGGIVKKISEVDRDDVILDIGPEAQADYARVILKAKTLVWNGPVGYIENPQYARGTDFLFYTLTHNSDVFSIVGGGDTLAAISHKSHLEKITHISTGGGAMLEFIENGTLPGIEALKK